MNHLDRVRRSLASLTRRAGLLLTTTRPDPPRRLPPIPDRPARPHTRRCLPRPARSPPQSRASAHGRARCGKSCTPESWPPGCHTPSSYASIARPTGFRVSRTGGQTARRPWCLSCCQGLDRDRCDVIPFDS